MKEVYCPDDGQACALLDPEWCIENNCHVAGRLPIVLEAVGQQATSLAVEPVPLPDET